MLGGGAPDDVAFVEEGDNLNVRNFDIKAKHSYDEVVYFILIIISV